MANKRRILTVTLLIAISGAIAWLFLRPNTSEPIYQSRSLSDWLRDITPQTPAPTLKRSVEAVRQIGTNAIPTLLRLFDVSDSDLKVLLTPLAQKQHLTLTGETAEARHYQALQGFLALGPDVRSAVPGLIEIYNHLNRGPYNTPWDITYIFAAMGPAVGDAIPPLVQNTTSPNTDLRWMTVRSLGYLHVRPDLSVPALTSSLRDPDTNVRGYAASSLAAFGTDAKSAVPDLVKILADPSPAVRDRAASALIKIDPDAAAKAGVK